MSTKDHLNFNEIDTHSIDGNFMEKKTWSLAKPIRTRRTSNSQKTSLMCIHDGFNPLAHLHTAYTTALTHIMTATYKLSRYGRMDDLGA